MTVNRALFGEYRNRHQLLGHSLSQDFQRQLADMADLTDRPPGTLPQGYVPEPYLTGFIYGDWYVLMRTITDQSTARSGFVRSFCLLLAREDLPKINRLEPLYISLPTLDSSPIDWQNWPADTRIELAPQVNLADPSQLTRDQLELKYGLVAALVGDVPPVVWSGGQQTFEQILANLWETIPPSLRQNLTFGHCYSPAHVASPPPAIVTTPFGAAPRWTRGVVQAKARIVSRPEAVLAGVPEGKELRDFLETLPGATDLKRIKVADSFLTAYYKAQRGESAFVVTAARLMGRLAPLPGELGQTKAELMSLLYDMAIEGDATTLQRLSNLDLEPYKQAKQRMVPIVGDRFRSLLEGGLVDASLVELALEDGTQAWWREVVGGVLNSTLQLPSKSVAESVWDWWLTDAKLVTGLRKWIGSHADPVLFDSIPTDLPIELAHLLEENAAAMGLIRVFAAAVGAVNPASVAMVKILHLPSFNSVELGLEALRFRLGGKDFVTAALETNDERVWGEAGRGCAENSDLLLGLEPSSRAWRGIWLAAIRVGADPLAGFPDPAAILYGTLDLCRKHAEVDSDLLTALSKTQEANLMPYPERGAVWLVLPAPARSGFLDATANGLLESWSIGQDHEVEEALLTAVFQPSRLQAVVSRLNSGVEKVVGIYCFHLVGSTAPESCALEVVEIVSSRKLEIAASVAIQFAAWVRGKRWQSVAKKSLEGYINFATPTLYLLTEHTLDLLPRREKLKAIVRLRRPTARDDLLDAVREVLTYLYSYGPTWEGFWEDVGGEVQHLELNGTPDKQWRSAFRQIRSGKVSLHKVFEVAKRRFNHEELDELEQLLWSLSWG